MANIKWIGTQELGKDMEPLLTKYETVFIECEFHTVLMRAIRALKELKPNYRTNLFEEADWLHWDYDNPNNLNYIKDEMMREPNERVYLEIHPKDETYTVCKASGITVLSKMRLNCIARNAELRPTRSTLKIQAKNTLLQANWEKN